jgi:hypothetical protein
MASGELMTADRKGQQLKVGDVVTMIGRVERVTREGVFIKVRDGLSVYVQPDAVEVIR